jgi:hypothetical protein
MSLALSTPDGGTFRLHRIDSAHWVVHDHAFPATDSRHLIACIHEAGDDELEVIWLNAEIPLPTRYLYVGDVVEDLQRWAGRGLRTTRPTRIAHYRPLVAASR